MASSSHLWHYTHYDSLQQILTTKHICPSVCEERYDYIGMENRSYKMACFTNISIKDNKTHTDKYGDCCIGFKNSWVNRYKICPIIYCRVDGRLTGVLRSILSEESKVSGDDKELLLKYIKPYSDLNSEGRIPRKDEKVDKVHLRRYDEYEWRYIPTDDSDVMDFDTDDIYRIYVDSEENMTELQAMFPTFAKKIKISKQKK